MIAPRAVPEPAVDVFVADATRAAIVVFNPFGRVLRRFALADHIQVTGADLNDGLLTIDLVREVPEAMKPRRIPINGTDLSNVRQIDSKAA